MLFWKLKLRVATGVQSVQTTLLKEESSSTETGTKAWQVKNLRTIILKCE